MRLRNGDLLFDLQTTFNQYLASLRTLQSDNELEVQSKDAGEPNADNELTDSQLAEERQPSHVGIQAACAPTNPATPHDAR